MLIFVYVSYLGATADEQPLVQNTQPLSDSRIPSQGSTHGNNLPTSEEADDTDNRRTSEEDLNISAIIMQSPEVRSPIAKPDAYDRSTNTDSPTDQEAPIFQDQEQSSERKPVQRTFISTLFSSLLFL